MRMAYTSNPHIGKVRAKAVQLVQKEGWSMRQAARHVGVSHSTIVRWCKRVPEAVGTVYAIETRFSRPKTSPNAIDAGIVARILELRDTQRKNGPEAIAEILKREGVKVSFSSVYRTLKRNGRIAERSPWKKYHKSGVRPYAESPGKLVQMDSIHILKKRNDKERIYIVTLIDVYSRWTYARAFERISARAALNTFTQAQRLSPFCFDCVQSDHGPEFQSYFTSMVEAKGTRHRHSRVRQPNDNAHVERFNRTIQEEMKPEISKYKNNIPWLNRSITEYLNYYNNERLHAGINHKTPNEMINI
jgi:IS30 family transposase